VPDLHWSDCGEWGANIAQHSMPDQNSVVFWKDCAAACRDHPAVIFDLYNEPHDVTCKAEFDTQIRKQKYVYEFKVEGDKLTGLATGHVCLT